MAETLRVAERCQFSLDELRYQYPSEVVPEGETPPATCAASALRRRGLALAAGHLGRGSRSRSSTSWQLITELHYEHYFLTVYDIVAFARSQGILCQGRGSAANSVVCYCLGITEVDPARTSVCCSSASSRSERNEPPDIDVDFEHERREEVIQYLYRKYGRERAALTATVISYRPRSAIRDVGKALGFAEGTLDVLAKGHAGGTAKPSSPSACSKSGSTPTTSRCASCCGSPRSSWVFRATSRSTPAASCSRSGPLSRLVPIENASMADRTVIEWDKDDLDAWACSRSTCSRWAC